MSASILLTRFPVNQQSNAGLVFKQNMFAAVDVSRFDVLNLELVLQQLSVSATNLTVDILTGWDLSSEDIWYRAGSFGTFTTAPATALLRLTTGFQRLIRWQVTFGSSTGSCEFNIRGTGETY